MHYEDVPQALKVAQASLLRSLASDEPNPETFGRATTVVTGPWVWENPMEVFWPAVIGPPTDRLLPPSSDTPTEDPANIIGTSLSRIYAPHARSTRISESDESYVTAYTADTYDTAVTSLP